MQGQRREVYVGKREESLIYCAKRKRKIRKRRKECVIN
jgi:hypothetical protein